MMKEKRAIVVYSMATCLVLFLATWAGMASASATGGFSAPQAKSASVPADSADLVDINSASKEQLDALPGTVTRIWNDRISSISVN